MVYRLDNFQETNINPITHEVWDDSWIVFILNNEPYRMVVGSVNGCTYTLKVSKNYRHWQMALGDFLSYNNSINKNVILAVSEQDYLEAVKSYEGHTYNDKYLREYEEPILIHSTTDDNYHCILEDGCLKSWNQLHVNNILDVEEPIGKLLGDPIELRDFILFGSGTTGEIVVNSKQLQRIEMNDSCEYKTGARLYFDIKKLAEDGLIIRDGSEIKVKDILPLNPYLIWAATWDSIGLKSNISSPKVFAMSADKYFQEHIVSTYVFEKFY